MSDAIAQIISEDVHCISCGYNLRGLDRTSRCPECGQSITSSYHGNLLRFANPEWLAKIKLGADLMFWGIVASLAVGVTVGCASAILGMAFTGKLLEIAGAVLHLIAVYFLTALEPRVSLTEKSITWRKIVRIAAGLSLLGHVLAQCGGSPGLQVFLPVGMIILMLASPVTLFGEFAYAHSFALRIPDPQLARSTNVVKWGLSILALLLSLFTLLMLFFIPTLFAAGAGGGPASSPTPASAPASPGTTQFTVANFAVPGTTGAIAMAAGLGVCVIAVVYLFFALWGCRLLWRYRKALRLALEEARYLSSASK